MILNSNIDINDRLNYALIIKKYLKENEKDDCLKINKIRNKNRIIYLNNNKTYKYSCKISKINYKSLLDLKIQKKLTKEITKCPHFSILYKSKKCNNYLINYNELANDDLKSYLKITNLTTKYLFNAICQIFLSLMFYYQIIKKLYNDSHDKNFLYHKIKKGGYFYYKIFNKDYYLENLGYLWIIIDFEYSSEITNDITYYYDYSKILYYFLSKQNKKINNFYDNFFNLSLIKGKKGLIKLIKDIIELLEENKVLLTILPENSVVINKNPYILNINI
jgi:hypothetical protein